MSGMPDPRIPGGPLSDAWQRTKEGLPLISPLRKSQIEVLVVGTDCSGIETPCIALRRLGGNSEAKSIFDTFGCVNAPENAKF